MPSPPPLVQGNPDVLGLDRAVVLVGPMAAGKTSLGKRLARALNIPFVDSDARIVQQHGVITQIFEQQGESAFREMEATVIAAELARKGPRVLALGGGAVLTERTRQLLRNHPVLLLMTTEKAVLKTANLSRRPLLKNDPGAWQRILDQRRPLYEEVADVTFRTDRFSQSALTEVAANWITTWASEHLVDTLPTNDEDKEA
ncbi:shikimate kinase [Leucobacter chinensis]|uniref:shikimate kinase n=1 Tax=Leucobacter chinensis TaxID=2851010 RepID=UPI00350FA451